MSVKNITGAWRVLFNLKIRMIVFVYFLTQVLTGKLSILKLVAVLRRLELFLSKVQDNKFISINGKARLGLYVPGAPSLPFQTACNKFVVFGDKLPNTTVLISITSACGFKCEHCYQKNDIGKDVKLDTLLETVKKIQETGCAFFNIEGGEPFLAYDRLKAVCETIDGRSEIWINSTGDGMTTQRLFELRELGLTAVMFPLHSHIKEEMNSFMGVEKAWQTVMNGVQLCHDSKVTVAFNMCLSKEQFYDGSFEACMELAREKGAAIVQIIKPKAAGAWLESGASEFSECDIQVVRGKVMLYNHDKRYSVYPAISAQVIEESPEMFGCTAGGTDRFYINAKGDVQPCEFFKHIIR